MIRLMGRETLLVLLSGLLGYLFIPGLLDLPAHSELIAIGLMMGLAFMAIYSLGVLVGNKLPPWWRNWTGVLAWMAAFASDLFVFAGLLRAGAHMKVPVIYLQLAPGLLVIPLLLMAAFRAPEGQRQRAVLQALFAYSLPMLAIRRLLTPIVSSSLVLTTMSVQLGVIYVSMRVLFRILWPEGVEGNLAAGPLVRRPVPDAIAGLVETTARRRARPFATETNGDVDQDAISVLCQPNEAQDLMQRLSDALKGRPFVVSRGRQIADQVELVVRRRREA